MVNELPRIPRNRKHKLVRCGIAPGTARSKPMRYRLVPCADFSYSRLVTHSPNCGAMVQRLARGPFKAEIRVRFPLALPTLY